MKKASLLLIFLFPVLSMNGQLIIHKIMKKEKEKEKQQQNSQLADQALDSAVYKTYKLVKYEELPDQVKILMDSVHCGKIMAEPNKENDYTTNINYGYSIDLNHDSRPEYIFCCIQPMHGPCNAKIFSHMDGAWRIIMSDFIGYSNEDPMVNIRVLQSKHEGFSDLFQNDKHLIFKNRQYQSEQ